MVVDFRPSRRPTLGVEWELGLVDARTGDLVSSAAAVVEEARGAIPQGESRVHRELLRNTVELVTGICESVPQAIGDLRESRDGVRRVARQRGLEIFSAGTHPFARWYDQEVSEGERYATLIERTQWWGRHMLIFGVHVHVGVDSVGKVLPILNALLRWFPHLQALSASSPFWGGADTGYASNRALMFQQLPTAGLPFQFDTWPRFEAYVGDMLATGVISDFKEIRWDIRPSPALGTIEVRVCDGLPTLGEVAAIAALTHCLVVDLDRRLEAGEALPALPPWHVQENKWRAARYGNSAGFYGRFFLTAADKLEFLEQCVTWPCHGDPTYTYSDVERAVVARLTQSQIVAILSSQIAVERRRRELALLSELKARYEPIAAAPATAEIPDLFG